MKLRFVKMEGVGNDYVYVDAIHRSFPLEDGPRVARIVADRHFGVGGDGLIIMAPSRKAACRMVMWNADGSRGGMCGNGIRCLGKLAFETGAVNDLRLRVDTDAGVREVELLPGPDGTIEGARVDMGAVTVEPQERHVELCGRTWRWHAADAGNPHAVVFVEEDPDAVPVAAVGAAFQALPAFPDRVNVDFVQVLADGSLKQRTFERGSGETLACGSGATVAALAALLTGRVRGPRVTMRLRGGMLWIERTASALVMEGPARTVFSGEMDLPER